MKVVSWSGLVVRLHRFEIIAVGIALAVWIAVALVCAWQISDVVERYPGCFRLSAPGLGRHEGLAVAGELLPDERKILINQDLLGTFAANPPLLRFTLAHEIGHWLLHSRLIIRGMIAEVRAKDGTLACRPPDVATSRGGTAFRLEYQASLFASHLLAPDALLLAHLRRFGCNG